MAATTNASWELSSLAMDDGGPLGGRSPEAAEAVLVPGAAADVGNTAMDGADADGVPAGKAAAALSVAATPPDDTSAAVASGAPMAMDPPGGAGGGDGGGGASAATAAAGASDARPRASSPVDDSDDNTPVTVVDMSHEPTGGIGVGYTLPPTVEVSAAVAESVHVRLLIRVQSSLRVCCSMLVIREK